MTGITNFQLLVYPQLRKDDIFAEFRGIAEEELTVGAWQALMMQGESTDLSYRG
jgi:hypothetical protein